MTTTIKKLVILQAVLVLGLGAYTVLPKHHGPQPVGISMDLPVDIGPWHGEDAVVTDKEKSVLGRGTEFARKIYQLPNGAGVFVSIVLSGHDVDTSLHSPHRCLPAQGWTVAKQSVEDVPMENGKPIPVTRLLTIGKRNDPATKREITVHALYYFWFVGCKDVVATAGSRSVLDWRDRIFRGYDQRWAYVTLVVPVRDDSDQVQEGADAAAKKFIAELFPKIWKPDSGS